MPGATPNRGYPYPLDADPIDPPTHIENLALALDGDVQAEATARANTDAAIQVDYNNKVNAAKVTGHIGIGPGITRTDGLAIQGGWAAITLDGFGHGSIAYAIAFTFDPVVIVAGGSSANPNVSTTGLFTTSPPNSLTELHVVANGPDGGPMADAILVFYWLAFGPIT